MEVIHDHQGQDYPGCELGGYWDQSGCPSYAKISPCGRLETPKSTASSCYASLASSQANAGLGARCAYQGRDRVRRCVLSAVPLTLDKSDYVPVGSSRFTLRLGGPGDLNEVQRLSREAAEWLRARKNTDQWARPWPDRVRHEERMLNDLVKGKTRLLWDGAVAAGTITVDTAEPVAANDQPIWPERKRREPALYVRRVIVSRKYAGLGLGAALLNWAADVAERDHAVRLIRVDVWTTNVPLHAYYERQRFTRQEGRDPGELAGYPSQALFERDVNQTGSDYRQLLTEVEGSRMRRSCT
jgi:GNAT superfamily N-acetyltransferase